MNQEEIKIIISADATKLRQELARVQQDIRKQAAEMSKVFSGIFSPTGEVSKSSSNKMANNMRSATNSAKDLSKAIEDTTAVLDNVNARIEIQRKKLAELKESYRNAFSEAKKNAAEEKILKTEASIMRLTSQSDKLGYKLADLDDKMAGLGRETSNTNSKLNGTSNAANNAGDAINRASNAANKASGAASKVGKSVDQVANKARKADSAIKSHTNSIGSLFKQMLVWNVAFGVVSKGLNAMASGLYNTLMTNKQFSTSLAQIKTNLMVAFTPIYEAILPAINTLMNALSVASQYIASFISAIFGSTYSQSVQATQGLIDAKNAMGVYGDSAKQAQARVRSLGEETEEALGLASFDEINSLGANKNDSGSGGAGGSGGGAGGGGINVPQLVTPALNTANVEASMKALADKVKAILSELLSPLKTAWDNYGDWFLSKWDYFKDAFKYNTDQLSSFLVSVWNNGGEEFVQHLGEIGIAIGGTALEIGGDILVALGNLWKHLDPENNPYTRKFIKVMNDLAIAVRDFIISAGNWFGKFLDLGGQAFINVMGDIVVLVGTILAEVIRDAVNLVTKFMNSWAGSALIGAVAITLDIVAGAIKGVLIIVEKCHVALEVFLALWGTWKFTKILSGIGDTNTKIGKLTDKLSKLKTAIVDNLREFGKWIKSGLELAAKACKTLGDAILHPIDTLKKFKDSIKSSYDKLKDWIGAVKDKAVEAIRKFTENIGKNITSLGEWAREIGGNSKKALVNFLAKIGESIAGLFGLNTAELTAAGGATVLNVALGALGIGVIIAAIAGLVAIVIEIGDKFGWWKAISEALSGALDWVKEKVGGLWNGVKSFFGWDEEPAANEKFDSIGQHAEEAAKTTDDAFGTASSNVNQYLDSIHFNATRLAEEVNEATASANEKFGLLSKNAQDYLDALVNNDQEALAKMGENQSAYMEEVKFIYAELTEAEKNEFLKRYGIVQGVNDDMLSYEGLTYDERVARHAAHIDRIDKNETLSAQEKQRLRDEELVKFNESLNQEITIHQEAMNSKKQQLEDLKNKHGKLTDDEKQLEKDLTAAISEEQRIIDSLTDTSYDTRVTTASEANSEIKKVNNDSTKAQEDAYNDLSKTSGKTLDDINKALKKSKDKVKDFVEESKKQADKLKKAFDGIDKKISGEFKKAKDNVKKILQEIGDITTNTTKNLNDSWVSSLTDIAKTIKSKLEEIKNVYKAHNTEIKDTTTDLSSTVKNKISELGDSYKKSFDGIKTNVSNVMDSAYSKVKNKLSEIRGLFNSFSATLKVKIPHFYMTGRFNAETGQVPKVGVNYFARGGVVDRATLGVFGEAGKEAIVPLEHNTEWMDTLKGIMGAAFNEAMNGNTRSSNDNFGDGNLILQIDGSVLGKVAFKELRKMHRQGINVIPV